MDNQGEAQEETPVRLCRECAAEIPEVARKCKSCGSFQDARRFMTVSQSSVTFLLALFALLAHFSTDVRSYTLSLRDWVTGTSFSMNAGLVDIDIDTLSVILSSRRNHVFGVSRAQCLLHLPLDPGEFALRRLSSKQMDRGGASAHSVEETKALKWVGPFLLSYRLETPEFFRPFDIRMVTFDHVYTGFPSTTITEAVGPPVSFCTFQGVNQHNSLAGAALMTSAQVLDELDALKLLRAQTELDQSSGEEERRLMLIQEIIQLRE